MTDRPSDYTSNSPVPTPGSPDVPEKDRIPGELWADALYGGDKSKEKHGWSRWAYFALSSVVTPFGVLLPLIQTQLTQDKAKKKHTIAFWIAFFLFLILGIATILGAYINISESSSAAQPKHWHEKIPAPFVAAGPWYVGFGWGVNLLFLAPLLMVHHLAKRVELLTKRVICLQDNLCYRTDNMLGDKVWSGPSTYKLLQALVSAKSERAKWQIINFLAFLADERILEVKAPPGSYRITTASDGAWDLMRYSAFLKRNIASVEASATWLVDTNDFADVLLPEHVQYYLVAVARHTLKADVTNEFFTNECCYHSIMERLVAAKDKEPAAKNKLHDELKQELQRLKDTVSPQLFGSNKLDYESSEGILWKRTAGSIGGYTPKDRIRAFGQLSAVVSLWSFVGMKCLEDIAKTAAENKMELQLPKGKELAKALEELYEKWFRHLLPHVDAFRSLPPEIVARRIFVLRQQNGAETAEQQVRADRFAGAASQAPNSHSLPTLITALAKRIAMRFKVAFAGSQLEEKLRNELVRQGLETFRWFCGRAKIEVYKENDPGPHGTLDFGVYDGKYVVCSQPVGDNVTRRRVTWYYVREPEKLLKTAWSSDLAERQESGDPGELSEGEYSLLKYVIGVVGASPQGVERLNIQQSTILDMMDQVEPVAEEGKEPDEFALFGGAVISQLDA